MNHYKKGIKILFVFFLLFLINSASAQVYAPGAATHEMPKQETKFPEASAFANSKMTYKIINATNSTFGYDIFADTKLMIHQPAIPGVSGNQGFKTKADAEKIAQLVIAKIKKGEMPPTITIEEMKKLKAIN